MDKRVRGEVEVAEEQFGFMPGRGTTRDAKKHVFFQTMFFMQKKVFFIEKNSFFNVFFCFFQLQEDF